MGNEDLVRLVEILCVLARMLNREPEEVLEVLVRKEMRK